jgi:PAT family beta-lactamase induction signal transducer AmpG
MAMPMTPSPPPHRVAVSAAASAATDAAARQPPRAGTLATLSLLYIGQGLPFGFQATALPVQLREAGLSLEGIGMLGMLALPWALKPLWAPWVDAIDLLGLGRRRSWLLAMQAMQVVTCLLAATLDPATETAALLATVLAMNLWAATQDIATDGLAVDLLGDGDLGWGNSAQVIGYKVGMMTGGGLLVWLAGHAGWNALFDGMAALQALCMVAAWRGAGAVADSRADSHADSRADGRADSRADSRAKRRA